MVTKDDAATLVEQMIASVDKHRLQVVTGETGSGKTTRVPLAFLRKGLSVLVAQPYIGLTIASARHVAQLMGVPLGTVVGYETSVESCVSTETRLCFATDGLVLKRELKGRNRYDILIIDEAHLWNVNQSLLEALTWHKIQQGKSPYQMVVLMSATLDAERISKQRKRAPILRLPGQGFPIKDLPPGESVALDVRQRVEEGCDVLVFCDGKQKIFNLLSSLRGMGIDAHAELFPFYAGLTQEKKAKALVHYPRPRVVVTTNALEAGFTFVPSPGRQLAVIDTVQERYYEVQDGIETWMLGTISPDKQVQRRGRTGRVGPGFYQPHGDANGPFKAEIQRTFFDAPLLRLKAAGYDPRELPFLHRPSEELVRMAERTLYALGALDDWGEMTEIGREMARLPISPRWARMIVEAKRLGVLADVLPIAAILEQKGITRAKGTWTRLRREEDESDLFVQLEVWKESLKWDDEQQWREMGLDLDRYHRARFLYQKLLLALQMSEEELTTTGSRQGIIRACLTGMVDCLFERSSSGVYTNGKGLQLSPRWQSCVRDAEWLVGMPRAVEQQTSQGEKKIVRDLNMCTVVQPEILLEIAPQLVYRERGDDYRYSKKMKAVVVTETTWFNDLEVRSDLVPAPKCKQATEALVSALLRGEVVPAAKENWRVQLFLWNQGEQARLTDDELRSFYRQRVGQATTRDEIRELDLRIKPELKPMTASLDLSVVTQWVEDLRQRIHPYNWSLPEGEVWSRLQRLQEASPSTLMERMEWIAEVEEALAQAEVVSPLPLEEQVGRIKEAANKLLQSDSSQREELARILEISPSNGELDKWVKEAKAVLTGAENIKDSGDGTTTVSLADLKRLQCHFANR